MQINVVFPAGNLSGPAAGEAVGSWNDFAKLRIHRREPTMIEVRKVNEGKYDVVVHAKTETVHTVTLSDEYHNKLTGGRETKERLIERSFEFLLRHEPNTSILRSFDLPVINRYFPEYEQEISGGLGRSE
jgi:hypothetical protein